MHRLISTQHNTILRLLESALSRSSTTSTTIVCCSTRAEFLEQLQLGIAQEHAQRVQAEAEEAEVTRERNREIPASQDSLGEEILNVEPEPVHKVSSARQHRLLIPTLQLLADSQNVQIVFCSNIPILRAWLAHLQTPTTAPEPDSPKIQEITMLNMVSLHHGTSEFTLQGLQRTFALSVPSCLRAGYQTLRFVECQDHRDPTHPQRGNALWKAEVPLLSGSIKISGDGAKWAGHAISIGRIAGKWLVFEDAQR